MDGIIVVDKPVGPTSFDVVAKIRRAGRIRKVGHGGTLDPLASGVLPVCVGEGTKLAPFLLDADKEYEFGVRFGVETDTDDAGGTVTKNADAGAVDALAVEAALGSFRGAISQVPPAYAAIKRDGRALYDYARAGQTIEVAARDVTVFALEMVRFEAPDAQFRVHCSKGTYVRALARDLGRALGVGAHVTSLRRTRSGPFALSAAQPLDRVLADLAAGQGRAMPPAAALRYAQVTVDEGLGRRLRAGQRVGWSDLGGPAGAPRLSIVDQAGELIAVAEPRPDGLVRTLRVFGCQKPARNPASGVDGSASL